MTKKIEELRESLEECAFQAYNIIVDTETSYDETDIAMEIHKDIHKIIEKLIK